MILTLITVFISGETLQADVPPVVYELQQSGRCQRTAHSHHRYPDGDYRISGMPAVKEQYGISFAEATPVDGNAMYVLLVMGIADAVVDSATSGDIVAHNLVALEDDLHVIMPQQGGLLIRPAMWDDMEQGGYLGGLNMDSNTWGRRILDNADMMRYNHALVTELSESPRSLGTAFLKDQYLLD